MRSNKSINKTGVNPVLFIDYTQSSERTRNDKVLYYDCSNYYFEIEQEDGNKNMVRVKSIVQILSSRWDCSWTATASPLPSPFFLGTPMNRPR